MIGLATLRQLAHATGQLLYIDFAPQVRLCSYGAVHVLGQDWSPGDFEVDTLQVDQQGVASIAITLGDVDYAWARRLRAEFVPGIACEWHLLYRGNTGWETEQVFSGLLERPRISAKGTVQIDAQIASGHTAVCPRVPFESPYSLARGSELVINGTTYRVE
jgi:hypothetical protein